MKKFIVFICIFLCMFNIAFATDETSLAENNVEENIIESGEKNEITLITPETFVFKTLKGEIIEAGEPYNSRDGTSEKCQDVKVYINDEGHRATTLITYKMSFYEDTINYAKPFEVGDKVYIYTTFENGRMIGTEIAYRDNTTYLIIILVLFILAVIIIGGVKGIKSLISLFITIILIFYALVPGIMAGRNPLLLTILLAIVTVIVTFVIISGFNRKSYAAMIGTASGIIVSGIFAILFGNLMNLTGMCEETGLLAGLSEVAKTFDFRGILFSGIIIGALRSMYGCWNVYRISPLRIKNGKNRHNSKRFNEIRNEHWKRYDRNDDKHSYTCIHGWSFNNNINIFGRRFRFS